MFIRRLVILSTLWLTVIGCESESATNPDAGSGGPDVGIADTNAGDSGMNDAGASDAGANDTALADSGIDSQAADGGVCSNNLIFGQPKQAQQTAQWPLGWYGGSARTFERIEVPCASCGDGTPFAFWYSPAISAAGQNRLVVYYQGGGSTRFDATSGLNSAINNAGALKGRLSVGDEFWAAERRLFMDATENAAFIGDAHWVYVAYCTQDTHSGTITSPTVYDFTGDKLHQSLQKLIDDGTANSVAELEQLFPSLNVTQHHVVNNKPVLDAIEVSIIHRGRLNNERVAAIVYARLTDQNPSFLDNAEVLISGGSAGAFSAWYNFDVWADPVANRPNAKLTLAPMAGLPSTQAWDDTLGDVTTSPEQLAGVTARLAAWNVERVCRRSGGDHVATGNELCDDGLDLLDHYRLQRYPGRDIEYALIANKEDLVIVGGIEKKCGGDQSCFDSELLRFCKGLHRYGQHFSSRSNAHPFVLWQAFWDTSVTPPKLKRTHTPEYASILQPLQQPDGGPLGQVSLLGFLNSLAARSGIPGTPQIEHMPNVVVDNFDPNTAVNALPGYQSGFAGCNVPWPSP